MKNKQASIEEIQNIRVFKNLDIDTLNALSAQSYKAYMPKGTILYHEGEDIEHIYGIIKGKFSLSKYSRQGQKITFFILGHGDFINEVILDEGSSVSTAEAYIDSEIVVFNKKKFELIMKNNFSVTKSIIEAMGRKQRRLSRQLKNTLTMKIDKKLAVKLWKLSRDHGVTTNCNWVMLDMKLTITSLSYLMGASRETISRAMRILQSRNLVKLKNKRIYVRQKELLHYYQSETSD